MNLEGIQSMPRTVDGLEIAKKQKENKNPLIETTIKEKNRFSQE